MKNISIIMARGVEGCGVTKYTVEQIKWLRKNGYNVKLYAAKDKVYKRKYAHDIGEFDWFKFSNDEHINRMINECNASDVVIINSLPSADTHRSPGSGRNAVDNWKRALKNITKPIVLIQHDHYSTSINRNAALAETVDSAAIIFAHSTGNDFSQYVKSRGAGDAIFSRLFDTGRENKQIYAFQPGIDFDECRRQYWKPIAETDSHAHKWIGRLSSWKGYNLMFNWHGMYGQSEGWLTTLEGIEESPAVPKFRRSYEFYDELRSDINTTDLKSRYGQKASVFNVYKNDEMLHRMSRTAFGYQLSLLKPQYIERSIEYTHQEIVAVGAVPVFRAEYGDICRHRVSGDPLTQCSNSGTIWLSANSDNRGALQAVRRLAADPVMRDEYRHIAYEFYKSHQDSDAVFSDLMNTIKAKVT